MSGKAMGWALEQETEMPVDKLVLIAIGNFADENHQCFPARKTLAKMAMCSIDSVDRAIKRLIASGMLSKDQRLADRGGLKSNCYTLPVGDYATPVHNISPPPSRKMRPSPQPQDAGRGQPQDAATLAAPNAATLAARGAATKGTVIEPSIEQVTPKPPMGASADKPSFDWKTAFATEADHAGIEIQDGNLVLVNGTKAHWLAEFDGDEKALRNALKQAHAAVNPGSRKSLKVQVEAKLSSIVIDLASRSRNYQAAASANQAAKAAPKPFKLSRWG